MEFFIVKFPTDRMVVVDDAPLGTTNKTQPIEAGTHIFDLGDPQDYFPKSRRVRVSGTSAEKPKEIKFISTVVLTDDGDDAAPEPPRKMAKRVGRGMGMAAAPISAVTEATAKPAKKAAKKAVKKVAKKATKKTAKKAVKKVAKNAVKKTAKKAAKRPAKKVAKKAGKKVAKKAAKKVAKRSAKKTSR